MLIYTCTCSCSIITTQKIIKQMHNDKVARINDARKEGRLLYKIFYLTSLFVSFERVVPSLRVRESWRPNINEIFWPRSYGRQRCVFFVLHGCSTGPWSKLFCVLAFPTNRVYLRLPLYCLPSFSPISHCPQFVGLILPYITFKLPRSNINTPQRLRNLVWFPATGMCHFLPVHHLEWHFWPGQKIKT